MKKKGCLSIIAVAVVGIASFKIWGAYSNRPSALYERWMGAEVPGDVSGLDGRYRFAFTESTMWLSFEAPPSRVQEIVDRLAMEAVKPETRWHEGEERRRITIGTKTHITNWFSFGLTQYGQIPEDLVIYWKDWSEDDEFYGGWALYYSATLKKAFWTSIAI